MIFFISVEDGFFDYKTPLKPSLTNFEEDKSFEPTTFLFEYLCYKIVKKKQAEGKINEQIVLTTEDFLCSHNCRQVFIDTNAIHKKHIIIFIHNKKTLKWNLIAFLNLEEQLKNIFTQVNKKPISAKIISSNSNSDEDDFILNSTMDKLENTFDFKLSDDVQFEVDSINISDQPNTCIFLLNFIEGLIVQDDSNISDYIKKLYDEGSNSIDEISQNYLNSFNRINEEFLNIYSKYQNELNEYFKTNVKLNKKNINCFEEEIMNGNDEIITTKHNTELNSNDFIIEENKPENGEVVKDINRMSVKTDGNLSISKSKDELDMIQIEEDEDLNSDEEEEALKIMERENKAAKSKMREQERKLRQRLYKQKLRQENTNMYKDFGVIKEEDNESESESIDLISKMKEEEKNKDSLNSVKKSLELRKSRINKKNNNKNTSESNENVILKTDINMNDNVEMKNDEKNNIKKNNDKKSKSEKSIKLNVLRELEEAIEEFETEQDIKKNNSEMTSSVLNIKKGEITNNCPKNENKDIIIENKNNKINNIIENKEKKIEDKDSKFENRDNKNENEELNNDKKENQDENKCIKENKNETINNIIENKIEKKNNIKSDNPIIDSKKDIKMNKNIKNIFIKKDNSVLKKINSIPKGKFEEKETDKEKDKIINLDNKEQTSGKTLIKLKKSFTNTKRLERSSRKSEENYKKNSRSNSLSQKKPISSNESLNNSSDIDKNNNNVKDIKTPSNIGKAKDQENGSSNNNNLTNIYNTSSYKSSNSNNSRKNNELLKPSKDKKIKEKENILKRANSRDNSPKRIPSPSKIAKTKSFKNPKNNQNKKEVYLRKNINKNPSLSSQGAIIFSKSTKSSQKSTSSLKSEETPKTLSNIDKKNHLKEIEIKINKNNIDFSALDTSINSSPSVKTEERKGYYDLKYTNQKERDNNGNLRKNKNLDMNNDKNNGDNNSNINIENILSDDFESESGKNGYNEDSSFYGENRTNKKTMIRRGDKKIKTRLPPGKTKINLISYGNRFCDIDTDGTKKACGCIGEQANELCLIF